MAYGPWPLTNPSIKPLSLAKYVAISSGVIKAVFMICSDLERPLVVELFSVVDCERDSCCDPPSVRLLDWLCDVDC